MSTAKRPKLKLKLERARWVATLAAAALLTTAGPLVAFQAGGSSLEAHVTTALRAEGPALAGVRVANQDGVVELTGFVDTLAASDVAEQAASSTPSVRAVVNRIEVRPADRSASQIEQDFREILRAEPATESFEFDVDGIDDHGVLTISGQADSPAEKHLAELAARRVRGVRDIVNEIVVRPSGTPRADAEIEDEIRGLFQWDARVDGSLVAVSVRDGVASLAGVARTPMEKAQAIALAYVEGVKRVEAPELLVELGPSPSREVPEAASDAEIARALERALEADPRVPAEGLQVQVEDGVARLDGRVGRLSAKHAAEEDARNVVGVVGVSTAIEIVPTEELTDAQIRANVETALSFDPIVGRDGKALQIRVERGIVTVTGDVTTERERDRVVEAASRARGVLEVRPELTVAEKEPTF